MTVILRNLQNIVRVDVTQLRQQVGVLRRILDVEKYDIAVLCVDNDNISDLNSQYRGEKGPTDVLAFPFHEVSRPGQIPAVADPEEMLLGDIVLGVPYIYNNCGRDGDEFEQILPVMVNHGLCHVMGYDHGTREQWKQMYDKEMEVLTKFNKITGYNCRPLLKIGH
ncbi:hypothetical protein ScPMuIL_015696 [Solemya velum]